MHSTEFEIDIKSLAKTSMNFHFAVTYLLRSSLLMYEELLFQTRNLCVISELLFFFPHFITRNDSSITHSRPGVFFFLSNLLLSLSSTEKVYYHVQMHPSHEYLWENLRHSLFVSSVVSMWHCFVNVFEYTTMNVALNMEN